jgi:hypothetical protein
MNLLVACFFKVLGCISYHAVDSLSCCMFGCIIHHSVESLDIVALVHCPIPNIINQYEWDIYDKHHQFLICHNIISHVVQHYKSGHDIIM